MRLRVPVALATTLALVATLGGCFLLPTGEPKPSASADEVAVDAQPSDPEVGDCWTTIDSNWGFWESWRGDPAIDCEEDHQSSTIAVLDLLGDFDEIYEPGGVVIEDVALLAWDSCYEALDDFMGAPIDDWSRLIPQYFVPSKEQWKDGARWVRCDVLALKVGSSVFEQVFADLPDDASDLVDALDDDADYFDICIDTDDGFTGYGPYFSESAVYSYCSRDPMWRLDGYGTVPGEYASVFPGDDVMAQYASEGCLGDMAPMQWAYAHVPDSVSWVNGDRFITCWAYEWEVPEGVDPSV